jgi:hypothetical protein
MRALVIPQAAVRDEGSVEVARVWIAERGLHCAFKVGMYAEAGVQRETSAWGIILADMAGHVADALSKDGMGNRAELFQAILESFIEETAAPSSALTGEAAPKVS